MSAAIRGLIEVIRVMNRPCRDHSVLISREIDGELPPATRVGLRLHYVLCGACRHFSAQLRLFKRAAARLPPDAVERALASTRMPEAVRARILIRLRGVR